VRASYDSLNPTGFLGTILDYAQLIDIGRQPQLVVRNQLGQAIPNCTASLDRTLDLVTGANTGIGWLDWIADLASSIGYSDLTWDMADLTSCITLATLQQGFSVDLVFSTNLYCTFNSCPGIGSTSEVTDYVDGMEVLVDLKQAVPSTTNPVVAPSSGCVRGVPNYYNGDPGRDCALVRASSNAPLNIPILGPSATQSQGRMSVKGTIYAPSAAIDVDDFGIRYPLFSRGLVARTLMFRRVGTQEAPPAANNTIDKTPKPRTVTFTACVRDALYPPSVDPSGWRCGLRSGDSILATARVQFGLDIPANPSPTNLPKARVPKILWWTSERD
jgi:hypothetical protein